MRRPVTLSERARGYGLWPGDVLARLPGARLEHVVLQEGSTTTLTVSLSLSADSSPLIDVPVHVELTVVDARVRAWRPSLRARLRRRPTAVPEVVELHRGRTGCYRLLHTAGRLVVRGSELRVDVVPTARLSAVPADVAS